MSMPYGGLNSYRWFGFVGKPLLEFSAEQTADVDLKALFRA